VSNRTRSKADYTDQHIGSRTWSKIRNINDFSDQNLVFPLHSNGGSGIIEIWHKFINLWLWSYHFLRYNLCFKTFFLDIERLYLMFLPYQISIDAESNYLSNECGFIEIGQKLIELWRWLCHVFPLQLVFQNVFFRFWTFLRAVWNETKHQKM
jgi:hypothetical protein